MRQQGLVHPALVLLTAAGLAGLIAAADARAADQPHKAWTGFGIVGSEPAPAAPATVAPAPKPKRRVGTASVDVSGRWLGTWTVPGVDGTRSGAAQADLAQAGSTGRGKLILHDTLAAEEIPSSVRNAGGGGVPIVLAVTGARVRLEHELGSELVTVRFSVSGDRMAGIVDHVSPPVRLTLSRVASASMGSGTLSAGMSSGDVSLAKPAEPDLASQLTAVRALVERANSTAEAAASLAREASTKAEAGAQAEKADRGSSAAHGGLQAVASRVITFAFDKADLDQTAQTTLAEVAGKVREDPDLLVNLEGYTDQIGTRDYNIQLSQRRATAVLRYLVTKGVELSRIHWVGLGVLSGAGAPEEQAKKRRVAIMILSPAPNAPHASAEAPDAQPPRK